MKKDTIGRDVIYSSSGGTLYFSVMHGEDVIYKGRAIPSPSGFYSINVSLIARDWMKDRIDLTQSGVTVNDGAYEEFAIVDDSGNTLEEYGFLYDWSIGSWDGSNRVMSAPINGHADSRMKMPYTQYKAASGGTEMTFGL